MMSAQRSRIALNMSSMAALIFKYTRRPWRTILPAVWNSRQRTVCTCERSHPFPSAVERNAPMLPLVVQKLSLANPGWETGLTSAAIIVAQFATILMALLVTRANALGRKPLLLLAFGALPLRGGLCMLFDDPSWLLAVQVLDGVGGGLFEALLPLVLADIMGGTGHYSLARGVVGAVQGIGGSSSQIVAGYIVTMAGYNAAFLSLAMVATAGLLLIIIAMPETTPSSNGSPS